jgi:pyruvate dehydrogenase E2 component (dihydrolipoamide acetyltransferase)
MPALSPTMTEGGLAKWHVKEGDVVQAGDVIAEIETDKATMEVEAVDEGTVGRLLVEEGATGVAVNAVIALLLDEGEDAAALDTADTGASAAAPQAAPKAATEPTPAPPQPAAPAPAPAAAPAPRANGSGDRVFASPLARRMAEQAGIDIAAIAGSGPHGRVVKQDVEAAGGVGGAVGAGGAASPLAGRMAAQAGLDIAGISGSGPQGRVVKQDVEAALGATGAAAATAPSGAALPFEPDFDLQPLSMMRKTIADRLTLSKQTVPHFYLTVDCEIDTLLAGRRRINERLENGVKISVNDVIVKACGMALQRVPAANASYGPDGIKLFKRADVAVAVAIDGGLITPVIRDAANKGLAAISIETKDLAERARQGKLMPEEYQGGTFSISNLGMYGIKQFDAVINPPHGAILAIGAGEQRPVVKDGALAVATVMSCTLSCDHRVVDGAIGAEFLRVFKAMIEDPLNMLV